MMEMSCYGEEDAAKLDEMLLLPNGRMQLLPAEAYRPIDPLLLRTWCTLRGRYCLPTVELVEWIKRRIGSRRTVEVACGMGDLGFHCDVAQSDACIQLRPEVQLFYKALGQKVTVPPEDVMPLDAESIVRTYQPEVTLAAWLTQLHREGEESGCMFGADEEVILQNTGEYIFIGNERVHGNKRIMEYPHETFKMPWLVSRAADQNANVIYVWNGVKGVQQIENQAIEAADNVPAAGA
jgi:hypothetical protein